MQTISSFTTARTEATSEAIQAAYEAMLAKQREETEKQAIFKAAADAARLEHRFINGRGNPPVVAPSGLWGRHGGTAPTRTPIH